MVQFNFSERTIKAKVVYYGPPQSGKTTNLEQIHRITDPDSANRLISLNTAQDRTLFFDLLPFSLGTVSGYDFKIQLYTVPGQVQYNATRRVVLAGADAVVFVADSQKTMARENATALENMKVNLLANRLVPEKVPLVLQYNKQDLDGLLGRAELDRGLNPWGRKSFPAIAARGEGVMETFVAVVQDMLAAIAAKYNLREKGLDPEAVPEIVAHAFDVLLQKGPSAPVPPAPALAPPSPARVIVTQPDGAEPAYPGQVGPEVSPVSEELLHRAIRSNVDLAEVFGQLVHDLSDGLAVIRAQAEALASAHGEAARAASVSAILRESDRLRKVLLQAGRQPAPPAAPLRTGATPLPFPTRTGATPLPRPTPPPLPSPPRAAVAVAPPPGPAQVWPSAVPAAAPLPVPAAAAAPPALSPVAQPSAPSPAAPAAPPATLDALLAEVAIGLRSTLAARPVIVQSRLARGTPLPRCSPAGLRRSLGGFLSGLALVAAPASTIAVRAERKPVLLRHSDGGETKRDFLMLAFAHTDGLGDDGQQRVLKGTQPGPLGDAQRAVKEMGGFLRFAPLPGGNLETRLFLPL